MTSKRPAHSTISIMAHKELALNNTIAHIATKHFFFLFWKVGIENQRMRAKLTILLKFKPHEGFYCGLWMQHKENTGIRQGKVSMRSNIMLVFPQNLHGFIYLIVFYSLCLVPCFGGNTKFTYRIMVLKRYFDFPFVPRGSINIRWGER